MRQLLGDVVSFVNETTSPSNCLIAAYHIIAFALTRARTTHCARVD